MTTLIVIYGLPGSGKSSLARELALSGFSYSDVARHPEFRKRSMADLAAEAYLAEPSCKGLVVEGVLGRRSSRIRLINRILKVCGKDQSTSFSRVATFHLNVPAVVLATRRNRTVEEYVALARSVEPGNAPYQHFVLSYPNGRPMAPKEIALDVLERLQSI